MRVYILPSRFYLYEPNTHNLHDFEYITSISAGGEAYRGIVDGSFNYGGCFIVRHGQILGQVVMESSWIF